MMTTMNLGGDLLSVASEQFGLRLLSRLVQQSPGKNVIVSPIGLFRALSLYAFLADETARRSVRSALQIGNISEDSLHQMCVRMRDHLSVACSDTELLSATALWAGKNIQIGPTFTALAEELGIALFSGRDVTAEKMKQWAQEQTRGLFSPVNSSPGENGANLMNATYFRGKWESRFDRENTRDLLFYRTGGSPKLAPLMRQSEMYGIQLYRGHSFDAARIPYEGRTEDSIALHILLPRQTVLNAAIGKDSLTPFTTHFTLHDWDTCQSNYKSAVVDLMLPRFTLRQTHHLNSFLMQMGMTAAFQINPARAASSLPAIQNVDQQAYISVDEVGTTAAALTELYMDDTGIGPPPRPKVEKFHVNRPFLFFLTKESSGLLLFAGVVHAP